MLEIRHLCCSPYHPQTNGKLERLHETLKARVNLLVFTSLEALRAAMAGFRILGGSGGAKPSCSGAP